VNGFIEHLYTRLGTTSNYSATTDLYNSQITTEPAKPFPACRVFISRSLVTGSNSGDSLASAFTPFPASHRLTTELSKSKSKSKSKSELLYDWRFTANQFVLASSPLRLTTRYFFQLNSCGSIPYVTSSLMSRWVPLITFGHGPRRKHSSLIVACVYVTGVS
jgi:hypothetical protein